MKNIITFLAIAFLFSACYDDHSEVIPGQDFIPDEILAEIRENGQPIFEGLNPPDVSGRYRISPLELVSSNFPDNIDPDNFADENVEFLEIEFKSLTLEVKSEQAGIEGEGYGSFISGQVNNFTIYVRIEQDRDDYSTLLTSVYSGTLTENGISNLYTSIFMINDGGDPDNDLIEIGQGRLFKDGDGFSPKVN